MTQTQTNTKPSSRIGNNRFLDEDDDDLMIDLHQTVSIREIHRDVKSKGEMNTMISLYLPNGTVRTQALVDCGAKGANYMDRVFVQENQIPTRILKQTNLSPQRRWNRKQSGKNYPPGQSRHRSRKKGTQRKIPCDFPEQRNGYTGISVARNAKP